MFGFFSFIRGKTKTAVLAGIADSLADLDPGKDAEAAVARLQTRLAGQLPAPVSSVPESGAGLDLAAEARAAGIDLDRLPRADADGTSNGEARPRPRRK
jgi:hypothetical protein